MIPPRVPEPEDQPEDIQEVEMDDERPLDFVPDIQDINMLIVDSDGADHGVEGLDGNGNYIEQEEDDGVDQNQLDPEIGVEQEEEEEDVDWEQEDRWALELEQYVNNRYQNPDEY
jgi:hypothetical protein